ncbi:unnamed protein product [Scytosiphon promiscuus]
MSQPRHDGRERRVSKSPRRFEDGGGSGSSQTSARRKKVKTSSAGSSSNGARVTGREQHAGTSANGTRPKSTASQGGGAKGKGKAKGSGGSGGGGSGGHRDRENSGPGDEDEEDEGENENGTENSSEGEDSGSEGSSEDEHESEDGGQESRKERPGNRGRPGDRDRLGRTLVPEDLLTFARTEYRKHHNFRTREDLAFFLAQAVSFASSRKLNLDVALQLLQAEGLQLASVPKDLSEDVLKAAEAGAEKGAKAGLSTGAAAGVPRGRGSNASIILDNSTQHLAHYLAPYYATLTTPLKDATVDKDIPLAAAMAIFNSEHPGGASAEEVIGASKKKLTAVKSTMASTTRGTVFDSIGAALELFATHHPNFVIEEDEHLRARGRGEPPTLFDVLLRSTAEDTTTEAAIDDIRLVDIEKMFLDFWRKTQHVTKNPDHRAIDRGVKKEGQLLEDFFRYSIEKHSLLIEKDKDGQPVRGDYRSTEVFGVSTRTLNEVVLRVCSSVIMTMLNDLRQQRTDHAADNCSGSQESEEDPPCETPALNHEAAGFHAVRRAREWLEQNKEPRNGGGGKDGQAFNKELFKSLDTVRKRKSEKLKIRSVKDINDADDSIAINLANGILRPYLYKKPTDTSTAASGTGRRGSA